LGIRLNGFGVVLIMKKEKKKDWFIESFVGKLEDTNSIKTFLVII